jgi:dihydrofolate reductase
MIVSMIVAMDEARGIGHHGKIPWYLPVDLKRFKSLTLGHHIVMGRKTYESLPRMLAGRKNIVLSRNRYYDAPGCIVVNTFPDAIGLAKNSGESELFVIGGGDIYALAIPLADFIYLTIVKTKLPADSFFPNLNPDEWIETNHEEFLADESNPYSHTFLILKRKPLKWTESL